MNFSFASIKAQLLNKITQYSNLTLEVLQTSVYGVILDVTAYAIDRLAYYFEFLYRESIWTKAQLRRSLVAQSGLLNYKPKRRTGASGALRIIGNKNYLNYKTLTATPVAYTADPVQFNRWDQFTSDNGVTQVYATESKLYAGSYTISQRNMNTGYAVSVSQVSNLVQIQLPTAHGIPLGALVSIRGTKYYNGDFISQNYPPYSTANAVVINSPFQTETFDSSGYIYTGHIYLSVKEGVPKTFEYTAVGVANESIEIVGNSIDNDEIQVQRIDPVTKVVLNEVPVVDELYLVNDNTAFYCSIRNSDDFDKIFIDFGDGLRSREPVAGEHYLVTYAETQGLAGEIGNTGVITKALPPKLSVFGNNTTIAITNDEQISDGSDIEDIESIRINGKNLFFAGNRADTRDDYVAILQSHPAVHKALVYTEADLNNLTITGNPSVVYIAAISKTGDLLTVSQQDDISVNLLNRVKSVTDLISWQTIKIVNIRPFIDAKVKPLLTTAQIKTEVFNALDAKYSSLNTDFNVSVFESNVVAAIDDTDSIVYHTTQVFHCEKSENFADIETTTVNHQIAVSVSSGDQSDPDKRIIIIPESVKILIKVKTNNVIGPEILVGTGNSLFGITTASPTDELITQYSGIVHDPNWTISTGSIQGDSIFSANANIISYDMEYLTVNPTISLPAYVMNPTDLDPNGFFVRIMYKTKDGSSPAKYTNDVRLSKFNIITNIESDDVLYKVIG